MVLLYFMDGVKYDMMKECMPFLASLNAKPLVSDFGYSCACHATMYTSRYVEEHQTWFIWKRGDHSPYRWLNRFPLLKRIDFLPFKLAVGKMTQKINRNTSYAGVPCLVNLPLRYWPLFEPCDTVLWDDPEWKKELPNLFTILRDHGVPRRVVALHRGTKPDDAFREESRVDYQNDRFVYFFIGYTDNVMHACGEKGEEARAYLARVDAFIRETYEKAKKANDDVTVIAYSDHGHIDLEPPLVDINDYFRPARLNVNRYVHLIEANYARFWFRNDRERGEVTEALRRMEAEKMGFVLTREHYERYHLPMDPKTQGELIFYLAAPHEFTKTIWGFGHTVKSGHGFEPTLPKHHGFFCSDKPLAEDRAFAYLTDVLPSVLRQLDIPADGYLLRGDNIVNADAPDGRRENA